MSEPSDYEQEAAYDAFIEELKRDKYFIEQTLEEVSVENIQSYLGRYGDAIEARVKECISQSEKLHKLGFFGSSLSLSATAIEIIIRFLLLRPLVQGAFLSDEWANILSRRIATGRTAEDREILPAMLKTWGIDIASIKLPSGKSLWESFLTIVRKKRDSFVHKGEHVDGSDSTMSIECANVFWETIVSIIAKKFEIPREKTGKWCEVYRRKMTGRTEPIAFMPENPF